jgi:hypothetical protein
MPLDESVEPPPVTGGTPAPGAPRAPTRAAGAPLVSVPEKAPSADTGRPRGHRAVDVVVALLALVVLTVSLLGIAWVLRSD